MSNAGRTLRNEIHMFQASDLAVMTLPAKILGKLYGSIEQRSTFRKGEIVMLDSEDVNNVACLCKITLRSHSHFNVPLCLSKESRHNSPSLVGKSLQILRPKALRSCCVITGYKTTEKKVTLGIHESRAPRRQFLPMIKRHMLPEREIFRTFSAKSLGSGLEL